MLQPPQYLPPAYRFSGNDWSGPVNALYFNIYNVLPIVDPVTGLITTPGQPFDLTGCTVSGSLRWLNKPTSVPVGLVLPTPTGVIVGLPTAGYVSLSVPKAQTGFAFQPRTDCDPTHAMLLVVLNITDASGNFLTYAEQPLFVYQ